MSENVIELEASNLCATEDAFESFQATTMYEEDEYITLSDILPPQPKVLDLESALNELPSENDAVPSSFSFSELYAQNGNNKDPSDNNSNNVMESEVNKTQPMSIETKTTRKRIPKVTPTSNKFGRKRGRKKRTIGSKSVSNNCLKKTTSLNENSSLKTIEQTPTAKKRGRKPRNANGLTTESSASTITPTTDKSQSKKKASKTRIGGRRKKKNISESNSVLPINVTKNIENIKSNLKGKRNKKVIQLEIDCQAKPLRQNRGRKKLPENSVLLEENTRTDKSKQAGDKVVEDDETDNMCLSKLKLTIGNCEIEENVKETSCDDKDTMKIDLIGNNIDTAVDERGEKKYIDSNLISSCPVENSENIDSKDPINKVPDTSDSNLHDAHVTQSERSDCDMISSNIECESSNKVEEDDTIEIANADTTTRPKRRRTRKPIKYDVDSDDDPYANVELSDDEPKKKKKGSYSRYDSDSEYRPGNIREKISESSDSGGNDIDDSDIGKKRRRSRKKSDGFLIKSLKKGVKNKIASSDETEIQDTIALNNVPNVTTISPDKNSPDDDIEICLQSSVIVPKEDTKQTGNIWGSTNEFENFLARKIQFSDLKIKKASKKAVATLEIPVLDTNQPKKFVEMSAQTHEIAKTTASTQTSGAHAIQVKENIPLNSIQSDKACEFLKSIVNTTSELGQLMITKSEDFIKKKINREHVVDTLKMDYCVQKSFLLFKLAKHNLTQMEEDLAKQYETFLKENNLLSCTEEQKIIAPKVKDQPKDDSDCEIIEEPVQPGNAKDKSFNPKTVFLNKELSIKIAKKPTKIEQKTSKEKLDKMNNRHSVWISDSVMVKKVKPTQSFLAQDSRNKKPPDNFITLKMVNDFFKHYYRQEALRICSPYNSIDHLSKYTECTSNYFFVHADKLSPNDDSESHTYTHMPSSENTNSISDTVNYHIDNPLKKNDVTSPRSLFTLCIEIIQKNNDNISKLKNEDEILIVKHNPKQLFHLCLNTISENLRIWKDIPCTYDSSKILNTPLSLKELCFKEISTLILNNNISDSRNSNKPLENYYRDDKITTSVEQYNKEFAFRESDNSTDLITCAPKSVFNNTTLITPFSLKYLCNRNIFCIFNPNYENTAIPLEIFHTEDTHNILHNKEHNNLDNNANIFDNNDNLNKSKSEQTIIKDLRWEIDLSKSRIHNNLCTPLSLKDLCNREIINIFFIFDTHNSEKVTTHLKNNFMNEIRTNITDVNNLDKKVIPNDMDENESRISTNYVASLEIKSLLSLCIQSLQHLREDETVEHLEINTHRQINSLFSICVEFIKGQLESQDKIGPNTLHYICYEKVLDLLYKQQQNHYKTGLALTPTRVYNVKSLAEICFEIISIYFGDGAMAHYDEEVLVVESVDKMTINAVNTLSEEAFHDIGDASMSNNEDDVFNNDYYEEEQYNDYDDNDQGDSSNWFSQVEMKELRSCHISNKLNVENHNTHKESYNEASQLVSTTFIKMEPADETPENELNQHDVPGNVDHTVIKPELPSGLDEMTIIPESVMTKKENVVDAGNDPILTTNDLDNLYYNSEIFSQSAARIRRQHRPDSDEENDYNMSLLVPQTFEPLNVGTAKDTLMESSSGEENNSAIAKNKEKKKLDKRRGRPRKTDLKTAGKEVTKVTSIGLKEKSLINSDVAIMTRKMREKIRQEEKKIMSSESDSENVPLSVKNQKETKKDIEKSRLQKKSKQIQDEIQCNNIDSTDKNVNSSIEKNEENAQFPGFSAVDQNEIASYEKYVKFVYDKILPKVTSNNKMSEVQDPKKNSSDIKESSIANETSENIESVLDFDQPVEVLECQPTLPIFDTNDDNCSRPEKQSKKIIEDIIEQPSYLERYGWKCYSIDANDCKLYQETRISLDKLPESFVDTYFQYQNIAEWEKEDAEVDRLINLQSLNRVPSRESKLKTKQKRSKTTGDQTEFILGDDSGMISPTYSDNYNELTPSEDEGGNINDEVAPGVPVKAIENNLAKNSLMNDNESDDEPLIKKEPTDETPNTAYKPGPKSKRKMKSTPNPEALILTADKMMNKELALLHAPVVLTSDVQDISPTKETKPKTRTAHKTGTTRTRCKSEQESSEEEKQWVTTKEKLLKRMVKKQEVTSLDDAKRAKIISEYIEKRGAMPELRKRKAVKKRLSSKKFLERQKQFSVLSRELYSESAMAYGKSKSSAYGKGRRNIRKVLDKKSLAKSTVVANMEEFERKRRLTMKQNKLREILGCEEGVSVLVINDEVCLEYDFALQRPIVTIHPFFTKVMKAHQYEGVKFMWDACFESLATMESGCAGGGCILAHCMGLGKTLQVLALLHTVLTHPRVGMQRVLVCCPLSTVLNWVDEIHKWIGPVTDQIKVFELSKLKKTYERAYQLEDWYKGGGIFIIGYELFRSLTTLDPLLDQVKEQTINKIRTALLDPGPDIVVCDEGHLLKNDSSVLALAMSRVVTKRRIVLTGTPMQNNLREYYCMVNFVKPNLLGTYAEYSNRFENPIMNGQHRDSREEDIKLMKARTHILHKVLEGCLQRQEASVLYPYLLPKYEYTVFISLTKCQSDLYMHYLENYAKQSKQSILKDFHLLQKIWSHPQVLHHFQMKERDETTANTVKAEKLEDDLAREDLAATEDKKPQNTEVWWLQFLDGGAMLDSLESSNKFVAVFRILDECVAVDDKVLIFSTSLFTMDALEYFLKKIKNWSLGQEYYRLDGSVPPEVRQNWCREFNAEHNHKTKLFLISTRAGSLGLNMTAANRVIILDTSWNPAHDIQSIFRVYRFGQKKKCYIYRLVALGTMEQKIYERAVTKQAVSCRVVDEQQIDRHYNMAELTELYRFDSTGAGVACGVAVGVDDVVLLRVARDAALHAVHEHDSLLRGSSEHALPEHERAAAWMQFQEEHAHKQMQSQLNMEDKKIKKNQQKLPMAPFIPGTSTDVIQQETIKQDPDYNPSPVEPKSKRGRKKIVRCTIAVEPPTPVQSNDEIITSDRIPDDEEIIVEKISNILLKHDIQNRYGPQEIGYLIANVRKIVASGDMKKLQESDDLTRSIAEVLLRRDTVPQMPGLTDVQCESQNAMEIQNPEHIPPQEPESNYKKKRAGRPRKKLRKPLIDTSTEKVPEEQSLNESEDSNPITKSRSKRKAALAADKHLESIKNSIISLNDDAGDGDWIGYDDEVPRLPEVTSAVNIIPEPPATTQSTKKVKIEPQSEKKNPNVIVIGKRGKTESEHNKLNKGNMDSDSIVLSDDDDPVVVAKKSVTAPTKAVAKNPVVKKEPVAVKKEQTVTVKTVTDMNRNVENNEPNKVNVEKIPLHPSLLSNENFIKIVAHTYLAGNPMLDEDAATLAARYSTYKALQELKSTGKPIESGPIYDIAMKVLGTEVLKKLNSGIPKDDTNKVKPPQVKIESSNKAPESQSTSQKSRADVTTPSVSTREVKKEINTINISRLKPTKPAPATAPAPTPPAVVPVGLVKSAVNTAVAKYQSDGINEDVECILPDDDDVIISDPCLSALPLLHCISQPLVLKPVRSVAAASSPSNPPLKHTPPLCVRVASSTTGSGNNTVVDSIKSPLSSVRASVSDPDTICLDSDEEDAPAPPRPVPVKLTINPQVVPVGPVVQAYPQLGGIHAVTSVGNLISNVIPVSLTTSLPMQYPLSYELNTPHSLTSNLSPIPNVTPAPEVKVTPPLPAAKGRVKRLTKVSKEVVPSLLATLAPSKRLTRISSKVPPLTPLSVDSNPNPSPVMSTQSNVPQPKDQQQNVSADKTLQQNATPSGVSKTKTVCKPGDIIRIGKNGDLEILNRDGNKYEPDSDAKNKSSNKEMANRNEKGPEISRATSTPKAVAKKKTTPHLRLRSASSNSNNSSRSDSPSSSDPLSILKDVIHIRAPAESKPKITITDNTIETSKPNEAKKISLPPRKPGPPIIITNVNTVKPVVTKEKFMSNLHNKADGILKKLNNILTPANRGVSMTVDLTEPDTKVEEASDPSSSLAAPVPKTKSTTTTIVGTSKNIIISGSGKTMAKPTIGNASSLKERNSIRVTNMESIPSTSKVIPSTNLKRSATSSDATVQKKKKTEPMTLKDFDLDDFDDIIELE